MNHHSAEPRTPTYPGVIEYVVTSDGTVVEIHGIWDDFARANDAGGLAIADVVGHHLCDFVSGPATRQVYDALIERIGRTRTPIHFTFRCDAPDVRRHMRMDVVGDGSENVRFTSRIVREEPRPAQALLSTDVDRSDVTVVIVVGASG